MAMRSCRVTIQDLDGVARPKAAGRPAKVRGGQVHSVEVTASTFVGGGGPPKSDDKGLVRDDVQGHDGENASRD